LEDGTVSELAGKNQLFGWRSGLPYRCGKYIFSLRASAPEVRFLELSRKLFAVPSTASTGYASANT
jgi:hypothetical protein